MGRGGPPTLDAQKTLFQSLDISCTVKLIESKYSSSGRGRPRFPVRAMLLALMLMHLLQIPTVAMLATQLGRHKEYGELCGFNGNNSGRTPDRNTLSNGSSREPDPRQWRESSGDSGDKP